MMNSKHMSPSHYDWLSENLEEFFNKLNVHFERGTISAHADKCYSYRHQMEKNGIAFPHGVAIYLLTYERPFVHEVRETRNGWVAPIDWIINNKDRFLPLLNPLTEKYAHYIINEGG